MGHTIVLAHGVLGFGNPLGLPSFVNYFNGVAAHLEGLGHRVLVPQVNPVGSIAQRGKHLADVILRSVSKDEKVHIIAHSMGGLDARHAITNEFKSPNPVATLITIGTPHRGSPVADAIADRTDPLFAHIPALVSAQLERNVGALHDLTTGAGRHFDETTHDVEGVRYIQVAGDANGGGHELVLFQLAAVIAHLKGEANDGVVTRSSALRLPDLPGGKVNHENLTDWPGDHASEVGWSVKSLLPIGVPLFGLPPHLERYEKLVAMLH
jgi:triacylglycerol lipase